MDSATSTTTTAARLDSSGRSATKTLSSSSQSTEKKSTVPEPKPNDFGVTVAGRFDPDLGLYFVTVVATSSQTLIVEFPSQAAARYAQQLAKNAVDDPVQPKATDKLGRKTDQVTTRLNQTT